MFIEKGIIMVNWKAYSKRFRAEAKIRGFDSEYIHEVLAYAKKTQ